MADLSYVFFDTVVTGTAVFDALLFQVARGADATHTEDFTNMVSSGAFPAGQKFVIEHIGVLTEPAVTAADTDALFRASLLQVLINSQVDFWCPLAQVADKSSWGGYSNQTAAAGLQVTGNYGHGFDLKIPISVDGGVGFGVRIKTTVATAASSKLVCALTGTYTRQ
jgi:hypothetical protein